MSPPDPQEARLGRAYRAERIRALSLCVEKLSAKLAVRNSPALIRRLERLRRALTYWESMDSAQAERWGAILKDTPGGPSQAPDC